MLGRLDFNPVGRHFIAGSAVYKRHIGHTEADKGPNAVDGGIAAPDNHAFFTDENSIPSCPPAGVVKSG